MRAVNLIPADQRRGSAPSAGRSEGAAYGVLALLAGLAILTVVYGLARHQIASRRAQAAALASEAQQAQAAAARLAPYTEFIKLHEQRMQAVQELVDSRFDWAYAFHELGRVLPTDVSLSTVTGAIASSSSTGGSAPSTGTSGRVASATPPGSVATFALSGCAASQAVVALTLERLRLIDGVGEVTLQSSAKSTSGPGASGVCPGPTFGAQVSFEPLPALSTAATDPASGPAASGSSTPPTTTSTGGAG
jgi:Tfp pilus assembly protein PilN